VKGLALSQFAPGPLAAQLAICLGTSTPGSSAPRWSGSPSCCRPTSRRWPSAYRWFDRVGENPQVRAFVGGVTAAAAGAIAGACVVLARRAIVDASTALLAVAVLALLARVRIPEPLVIAGGAAIGLAIMGAGR
jgi:chromate transporter